MSTMGSINTCSPFSIILIEVMTPKGTANVNDAIIWNTFLGFFEEDVP